MSLLVALRNALEIQDEDSFYRFALILSRSSFHSSTPTGWSWWCQWWAMAASHWRSCWRCWSDTLWVRNIISNFILVMCFFGLTRADKMIALWSVIVESSLQSHRYSCWKLLQLVLALPHTWDLAKHECNKQSIWCSEYVQLSFSSDFAFPCFLPWRLAVWLA
jgi:hypothetical protein